MFRFKSVRRSRSLSREPGSDARQRRKPPASDDRCVVPDESFAPTEPWDQHSSRNFQLRASSAASAELAPDDANLDGEPVAAANLETFLKGGAAAFDASNVKMVGMDEDEDDAASRGAYSTISTMFQAKRRRQKRSLRRIGTPGDDGAASDVSGSSDALDAFLSRNQSETAASENETGEERSRGAHTNMTGAVRQSAHRGLVSGSSDGVEGSGGHRASPKDPKRSKDAKADPPQSGSDHMAGTSSKSRSDLQSHQETSAHRSSGTTQQRRTSKTQRSESHTERNEEFGSSRHLKKEKSSRGDSLKTDMIRSSSSLRDPLRRSTSKRSMATEVERKSVASYLREDEKHPHRHLSRSSATVSGAPLTRNRSKEFLEAQIKHSESRSKRKKSPSGHIESHDSMNIETKKHHNHTTAVEYTIGGNGQKSPEARGSADRLKSQSRSSGAPYDGKIESVEKEFWNLLSTLKRPSNESDKKDSTSDLPRDITVHNIDSTDRGKQRHASLRKSSMHSHSSALQDPAKTSRRHPKNDSFKPQEHRDGSSSHVYDDKLRPSTHPDSALTLQLDEYGMIKIPSTQTTKNKEGKDRVHREKSSRTIESSRRYTEKDGSNRNTSPSRAPKSSRRNSSKYIEDDKNKPSRHRSHSNNRHSSVHEHSEKRSSSRRSSKTGEEKTDPDRKHRHHRNSRAEHESVTDKERRRGRERRRLPASSRHKSYDNSEKRTCHRSVSVQPSSHGHHKHRRAHSMTPHHNRDGASENHESIMKTKEHFRSLLKSGSNEEKNGSDATMSVPNKMLSIKGRFKGDEDNALPRMEDKTPVSPAASNDENSASMSVGDDVGRQESSNHAAEIDARRDDRPYIDLTDNQASPVPHIDLVDGVIVAQEKSIVDSQPSADKVIDLDNHIDRVLAQPRLDNEKAAVDGSQRKNVPIEAAHTGLWGMFRSRMKPNGITDEISAEIKQDSLPVTDKVYSTPAESNAFSYARTKAEDGALEMKTVFSEKQKATSHIHADGVSDDTIVTAVGSLRSANEQSPSRSQSGSPLPARDFAEARGSSERIGIYAAKAPPYSVNSVKSLATSIAGLKPSEMASSQIGNNDEGHSALPLTNLAPYLEPSDATNSNDATPEPLVELLTGHNYRQNGAPLIPAPTCNGKADNLISKSRDSIDGADSLGQYSEEDVFALFSWSSNYQEEGKVIGERQKLRGILRCTPLGRVLERMKPY